MSCPEFKNECPPVPPDIPDDDFSYAGKLAEALGGKVSCYRDKSITTNTLDLGIYSETQTRYNDITIGCQELQVVAKSYMESQRNISCVLNQSCNKQTNQISAEQIIDIKCKGEMIGKDINQTMRVKLVSVFNLSEDEIKLIEREVKNVSKDLLNMLENSSDKGYFKGEAQKKIAEIKAKIDNMNYTSHIKQAIREFNNSITAKQVIDIKGKKRCIFTQDIDQNMQIEMFASSIINTAIDNDFKSVFQSIYEHDKKAVAKTKENEQKESEDKTKKIIIVAVVILVIFIIIIIALTI